MCYIVPSERLKLDLGGFSLNDVGICSQDFQEVTLTKKRNYKFMMKRQLVEEETDLVQ